MTLVEEEESLVHRIEQHLGRTLAPPVRSAFLQVPRHLFVEQYYMQQENGPFCNLVQATPAQIYQDKALVTHIDARGMPTSSTSQPSIMAAQLEALAIAPGQRILEIGAGTGYNAALLGILAGETGQVISIESDEHVLEEAKRHLVQASIKNVLALPGDGFLGEATYAPYDRMITTCSIRSIPHAWFDQLKPEGRFVGNWRLPFASLFVAASKTNMGELTGTFLDLDAAYMEMQTKEKRPAKQKIDWAIFDASPAGFIELPHAQTWLDNPAYTLLLQSVCPHMEKRYRSTKENRVALYLLAGEAAIQVQEDRFYLFGDANIHPIIQQSVELYRQLGQPQISQYRVTFQERQAVIHIGDLHLQLPLS